MGQTFRSADYDVCRDMVAWLKRQPITPREAITVFGTVLSGGERHELLNQAVIGWDDVFDVIALEWGFAREVLRCPAAY